MGSSSAKHQGDTFDRGRAPRVVREVERLVLSIAWHADLSRIGERVVLPAEGTTQLGRLEPSFAPSSSAAGRPLDDPFLSRKTLALQVHPDGRVELSNPEGIEARSGQGPLGDEPQVWTAAALERGGWIALGDRALLWLERRHPSSLDAAAGALLGPSVAMARVRRDIAERARELPRLILLRGPTGTGKELVARALHEQGPRRGAPFVSVNMAAIAPGAAASALFGHVRGAFTGAEEASPGYFGRADGGTLFLDEVGELSPELQPMLLRALESGEIQPVGRPETRVVDAMVIAATDAPLESLVSSGRFRAPLYHRLSSTVIELPPLTDRSFDATVLLARALLAADLPGPLRDATLEASPTLPLELPLAVLAHRWPGNVRELHSVAKRLLEQVRAEGRVDVARLGLLPDLPSAPPQPSNAATPPRPAPPRDDEIRAALAANAYNLARAAAALGISRTYLDQRILGGGLATKAKDLSAEAIDEALSTCAGDVERAAARLQVSLRALKLRLAQLGR